MFLIQIHTERPTDRQTPPTDCSTRPLKWSVKLITSPCMSYCCRRTRATRIVLCTRVDDQCDKLATIVGRTELHSDNRRAWQFFYKSPEDGVLFSFILEIAEFDLGKTKLDSLTTKKLDLFVRFDTKLAVTRQTPARGI